MGLADAANTNSGMASNYDTVSGCSHNGKPNNQFCTLHNYIVLFTWLGHKVINVRVGNRQNNIHVMSFKRASEIFLSFQGGLSKTYRTYRKILNSDQ